MPLTPITDIGTAVVTGFTAALTTFFAALPSILGALIILAVGWIVAGWLGGLLARALRLIRLDRLADRAGVSEFLERSGISADPARVLGDVLKWYVRLVFVLVAANAVGLTVIATVVNQVLAFVPNLVVALVILGAFSWLAGITRGVVRGALGAGGMPNVDAIGSLAYFTVLAFGVVAAADQVGIAATLVNTLFIGVVAACALAFGLAFGLGGREQAAEIWSDWRGHATLAMSRPGVRPATIAAGPGTTDGRGPDADTEVLRRREEMARRS